MNEQLHDMSRLPSRNWMAGGGLAALLLLSAALRFYALDFAPRVPDARPDELAGLSGAALLDQGLAAPPLLLYGGGYFLPVYVIAKIVAAWSGMASPVDLYHHASWDGVIALRAWSAILSTATVGVVFLAARRVSGLSGGFLAAGLWSAWTLAVREAHFAKPDSVAAFAASLLLLALVSSYGSATRRAVMIGLAGALVVSTKLCVGFLPGAASAILFSRRATPAREVLAAVGVFAVALLLLNPFVLLPGGSPLMSAGQFHQWFSSADWLPHEGSAASPVVYHARVSLRFGCGLLTALVALPATLRALMSRGPLRDVAIAAVGYAATLSVSPMTLARFFLPELPLLAVLVAALAVEAVERWSRSPRIVAVAMLVIGAALVAEPLVSDVQLLTRLGRSDTRELAANWIEQNVSADVPIATWGAPSFATDYGAPNLSAREVHHLMPPARWRSEPALVLVHHQYPLPYSSVPMPDPGPDFTRVAVFDPFDGPIRDPVLEPLDAFYLPLARFSGIARPGPRIEIYLKGPRSAPPHDG